VSTTRALMVRPLDVSFPSRGVIRMPMANLQRILEDIRRNTEKDKENAPGISIAEETQEEAPEQEIRVWSNGLHVDLAFLDLTKLLLYSMQANFTLAPSVYASSPPRRSQPLYALLYVDEIHFIRQPSEYQIEEVD
jgi:hypothetical protein